MILTLKCKEDFLKWLCPEYDFTEKEFNKLYPVNLKYALIIEFFDGIKVSGFKSLWSYCFGNYDVFKDKWNEHTEQSIKKANEIYNGKNI